MINKFYTNGNSKIQTRLQTNEGELFYQTNKNVVLGRLIPIIVHEINNPIQAIGGAASLGIEEAGNQANVLEYFTLINGQSKRVMALTGLVRSIYSSTRMTTQIIEVFQCFDALMLLMKDDLNRNGVQLEIIPPDSGLLVQGNESDIQLALLKIMLDLDVWMNLHQCKWYKISFHKKNNNAIIDFEIPDPIQFDFDVNESRQPGKLDLSFAAWLVSANAGIISQLFESNKNLLRVEFPLIGIGG